MSERFRLHSIRVLEIGRYAVEMVSVSNEHRIEEMQVCVSRDDIPVVGSGEMMARFGGDDRRRMGVVFDAILKFDLAARSQVG